MYAGAFVSLATSTVSGPWASSFFQAQLPRVLRHLPGGGQQPPATAADLVNILAIVVVAGALVGACLWLWMAWENRHGCSWARVVSTVLFGISCVIAASFATGSPVGLKVAGLVSWAIGLVVIILLWRSASSQYFRTVKAARRTSRSPRHRRALPAPPDLPARRSRTVRLGRRGRCPVGYDSRRPCPER
jgi:hypothetical protein